MDHVPRSDFVVRRGMTRRRPVVVFALLRRARALMAASPIRPWALLSLSLLPACADACGCSGSNLGEVSELKGRAERDDAVPPEVWGTAGVGSRFRSGDAVRTRESSEARLTFYGGG